MAKDRITKVTYAPANAVYTSGKKNKYQVNNKPFYAKLYTYATAASMPGTSGAVDGWLYQQFPVISAAATSGKRKAGKFTISVSLEGEAESLIYWSLVHVGEDRANANWLNPTDQENIYKPSASVLSSGMNDTNAGPVRIYCPLFKNLNQNDKIFLSLCIKPQGQRSIDDQSDNAKVVDENTYINALVRYAICYN
ncbi:MAG: hypothetical protein J6T10_27985 [Methanobrevibacter sp.]|nr:hypothetical protein [Methanobrevibacter sp.]